MFRLGPDVDPVAGQACCEAGVLPLLADRKRKLAVGDDDDRLHLLIVEYHLSNLGRAQCLGDEVGGVLTPGNDVDLLAAQLVHNLPHTAPSGADARPDRIHIHVVRCDRDLGPVPGVSSDRPDLDDPLDQLGYL